jgi:transcriptional regulator with XRE-family HTH domain
MGRREDEDMDTTPQTEPRSFAVRLRQAMRAAGITQFELSAKADLDQSTISRYVRGLYEPNLRQLRAIANALGVKASDLLPDD